MINVIIAEQYQDLISENFIETVVNLTLVDQEIDIENNDLSVVIDSDDVLKELNGQYRGLDQPTDVLSFTANDLDLETGHTILGDIVISYPRAESQASDANHPIRKEIQLLIIHGVLHLLGYDHGNEAEKDIMWDIQNRLMLRDLKDN
jgi:probable rRNA maturation factor